LPEYLAARLADAGMAVPAINVNNSHSNNVARRQPRPGINTSVVFMLHNLPVRYFAAARAAYMAGLDGGFDGSHGDRGYEFPPHLGRQLNHEYHRPYYESEDEEEY
jgi:hypothetical protein